MKESVNNILSLERDEMSDIVRELFLRDLKRIVDEYFESDGLASLEVTRSEEGFIVCTLFTARRIKNMRSPQ